MGKIKYQGGLTKMITSEIGIRNKRNFAIHLENILSSFNRTFLSHSIPLEVVSFSSGKDFYDQILSILSFMRYAGTPLSWTIYSDGSHTQHQTQFLEAEFEFIKVVKNDWQESDLLLEVNKEPLLPYKQHLVDYAKKLPLGKKLFCYLNHKIESPTLFIDADVLFYKEARNLDLLLNEKVDGWYLPDSDWGCLDSRYLEVNTKQMYQANSGCFLLNNELNKLEEGLNFLKSLYFKYEYFSEQNILHIIFRSNNFMPLDPRLFILSSADQFDFSYLYSRDKIAVRHYTGPVRHKIWQKDWKWQLSLS